jgi:hypothetical protein
VNRRIALTVVVLAVVVLALLASACGNGGDPYAGTWYDSSHAKFVIAKASDGWYSIDNGPGPNAPHVFYAAELNGRLETPNARTTFSREGDTLVMSGPGESSINLTRQ